MSMRYRFARLPHSLIARTSGARNNAATKSAIARIQQGDAIDTSCFKSFHDNTVERVRIGCINGTEWGVVVYDAGGNPIFMTTQQTSARALSVQSTNSTSLVTSTELQLPILANATYLVKANIVFQSDKTSRGIGLALNGPASPVTVAYRTLVAASPAAGTQAFLTGYNSAVDGNGVPAADVSHFGTLDGIVANGPNAGTLSLRFRSANNDAIVSIRPGSLIEAQIIIP